MKNSEIISEYMITSVCVCVCKCVLFMCVCVVVFGCLPACVYMWMFMTVGMFVCDSITYKNVNKGIILYII